jgi:replicative DNA helicase
MLYSIEAEMATLGCMIGSSEVIDEIVTKINQDDFYSPENKELYIAILKLHNSNKIIDPLTVSEMGFSLEFITEVLRATYSPYAYNQYVDIVLDKSVRRKMIKAVNEISKLVNEAEYTSIAEFKADCMEKVDVKISSDIGIDKPVDTSDIVKLFEIFEERCSRNGKSQNKKEKYGFPWIDTATAGTHKGEVTILAARPGTGKTAFSLNVALNKILAGAHVKIFSLEMTKESLLERMIINFASVDGLKLRAGKTSPEDFQEIIKACQIVIDKSLYIEDRMFTLDEIRTSCRRSKNKNVLDYVIIDYLQLIECDIKAYSSNEKLEYISRKIKLLAKEMDVPILLLSQLNRSPEARGDRTPQLSDLRGSGAIEQDADNVFFLHHMPVDECNGSQDNTNVDIVFTIAKQRSGVSNKNNIMRFYTIHQRFGEIGYREDN